MGGIIMGALGGMGDALQNIGGSMFKAELDRDARQADSDLALARAKSLEEFKAGLATKERTAQVERINAETGRIADEQVAKKRGIINAGIADPAAWTPEMQAAVDQSLAQDREGIVNSSRTRRDAAVRTGDIKPDVAATIERDERRLDATERATAQRETAAAMRDETQRYIAELRETTAQQRIEALVKRMGGGNDGASNALSFLDGKRKKLQSEETSLRQMLKAEMENKSSGEQKRIKAEYEPKLDAIAKEHRQIDQDFDVLRERVGLPARSAKPEAAAPATPKPAGAASASAKPEVSKVQGLPAGSSIGAQTPKGWEVKDSTGKLIGYVRG